jgi:hypothetical protein
MITKKILIKEFEELIYTYFKYYDALKLERPTEDIAKLLSTYDSKDEVNVLKGLVDVIWKALMAMFSLGFFVASLVLLIILMIIFYA